MIKSGNATVSFQSTPSVGRATLRFYSKYVEVGISIHALRGEGDVEQLGISGVVTDISIHALRGEGDSDIIESIFLFL